MLNEVRTLSKSFDNNEINEINDDGEGNGSGGGGGGHQSLQTMASVTEEEEEEEEGDGGEYKSDAVSKCSCNYCYTVVHLSFIVFSKITAFKQIQTVVLTSLNFFLFFLL